MSFTPNNLASVLAACALLVTGVGCQTPWSAGPGMFSRAMSTPSTSTASAATSIAPRAGSAEAEPSSTAPLPSAPSSTTTAHNSRAVAASEPDLAAVMDKVRQVGEIDPGAQQKLVAELQQTDPKFWSSAAEQFRASLAYHQELAARPARSSAEDEKSDAYGELSRLVSAEASPSQLADSDPSSRPSSRIGGLPDPRHADADGVSSESLAQTTPYSNTLPVDLPDAAAPPRDAAIPARFVSEGPTYPLAAQPESSNATAPAGPTPAAPVSVYGSPQVVKAGFETASESKVAALAGAASAPAEAMPRDWQQLVTAAADDLSHKVAESPATTAEIHQHVSLRILRLLAGQTEGALEPIPHIAPVEQDYWSRQMFALATYLDHHSQPDNKRRAAASVTHLDEAMASLRDLGTLSARNLTFCKNVYGYGAVEPYKEDRFAPGEQVQLYVEVENYHSESTEKGFTTSLGSTYELLDEKGQRVEGGEFPTVDDCCRSRRRDFHIQFGLTLPEKIKPGRYQLQIVVRDRLSDKIANAQASFEVRDKISYPAK